MRWDTCRARVLRLATSPGEKKQHISSAHQLKMPDCRSESDGVPSRQDVAATKNNEKTTLHGDS
jgi:hypothetical protein